MSLPSGFILPGPIPMNTMMTYYGSTQPPLGTAMCYIGPNVPHLQPGWYVGVGTVVSLDYSLCCPSPDPLADQEVVLCRQMIAS